MAEKLDADVSKILGRFADQQVRLGEAARRALADPQGVRPALDGAAPRTEDRLVLSASARAAAPAGPAPAGPAPVKDWSRPPATPADAKPGFFKRVVTPILKLVMGDEWGTYITRPPLPANSGDVGPGWLTAITRRLDGTRNESIALMLQADVAIPMPLPGVTLGGHGQSKAILRRRASDNMLELGYEREIDPKASVGVKFGVGGGVSLGDWHFQGNVSAGASLEGRVVHRANFLYEVDPKDPQAMDGLAHFLGVHALAETMKLAHQENPDVMAELRRVAGHGTDAPAKLPTPIAVDASFSHDHLEQLGVYHGVLGRADAGASTGLGLGKRTGAWGWLHGPGMGWGQTDGGPTHGTAQNFANIALGLVGGLASFNGDINKEVEKGVGQIVTFDHGTPVAATMSASTSQLTTKSFGLAGFSRTFWSGPGDRVAATFDPKGKLIGLDHSVKSTVTSQHTLSRGETPPDQGVQDVLDSAQAGDMVVLTYSLHGDALNVIAALPAAEQPKAVSRAFAHPDQFGLTRTVAAHNNRFSLGGSFNFGVFQFGAAGGEFDADHQFAQIVHSGPTPADPLPNGRPW